ncbi:peptidoglycan recognition protein family protein [Paracidovorax konjaci]|uniref:N-acetylmuramoyl-L-alanine amidase n=1 Tax=Paracidovorax konjaci TaxID=32040 RepID=A0A1I1VUT0_9BURK|nr:N-acetylmuramoyl-L-alanine amidase [Paracidovorax konjaci]SFD86767.1 N-acetylmuramoyl-L-alanine amidase [Paracidovorax konjaci]
MLTIDPQGMVIQDARIIARREPKIERGRMDKVNGIVVHQTNTATETAVFNSYGVPNANGAHFLIAKDGTVYQTASLFFKTNHVGRLRARCIAEKRCAPSEIALSSSTRYGAIHSAEMAKPVPARYPSNTDSIGIEIVGVAVPPPPERIPRNLSEYQKRLYITEHSVYETLTGPQQQSLQYLIDQLTQALAVPKTEIHRHPDVSYKNRTEASTAAWQ